MTNRWFESLSVRNLWKRQESTALQVLRANSDRRQDLDDTSEVRDLPIRQQRIFPDDMPRPGAEYGATGTPIFGGFITGEDYNPKLDGAKALQVYDEMRRSDAQVRASLQVLKLPLLSASWEIDPPQGSTDGSDIAIADFCESALFDSDSMAQPWGFTLNQILLKLDFGVSLLEKVFTVGELGEIRYHRLAPRGPKTIFRWIIDPETGGLEAIVQFAPKGGAFQYLTIPAKYAAVFTYGREGDQYFGRSVLRSSYMHWFFKTQAYRIDGVRLDRHGVGIPMATVAENHRASPKEFDEIKQILRGLRTHERAYIVAPAGVTFSILVPRGDGGRGGSAGLIESVNHHNFMIGANILAGFLTASQQTRGALAHTSTLADMFEDSLQALADETGGEIVSQLIRPLCDLNFDMTGRKYPDVRVSGVNSVDIPEMADAISKLGGGKMSFINPDGQLEDWLRDLLGAPPREPESAPLASGGVESPSPSPGVAGPGTPGAHISSLPARSSPAESAPGASRLGSQTPQDGQTPAVASRLTIPGDTGGSVTGEPLKTPRPQPPMTEATSEPKGPQRKMAGQPDVGPTTIELDPTVDVINAPDQRPRSGLGPARGPQGQIRPETAYGFGGPRRDRAKHRLQASWPEGPLGTITPPPPPGGASGAHPLGQDTRIGANDGFPLGLRHDPVFFDGRFYSRTPSEFEQRVFNLHEIPDTLDQERERLMRVLVSIRKAQLPKVVKDLVKRDSSTTTGAFTDLRPERTRLPMATDVYKAIRQSQDRMAQYGALQVRAELQKQGAPVTMHSGRVSLAAGQVRRVYLIRHGETPDDRPPEKISSYARVSLDDSGRQTARELARLFSTVGPLRIICSDLERAVETAAIIADDRSDASVTSDANLRPWHLGDLTGSTVAEAQPAITQLLRNPDEAPPNGESRHAFEDRYRQALVDQLDAAPADATTILLSHSWNLKDAAEQVVLAHPEFAASLKAEDMAPGCGFCVTLAPSGHEIVNAYPIFSSGSPIELADLPKRPPDSIPVKTSALVSSAKVASATLGDAWRLRILDSAIRIRRTGVSGSDLERSLLDELGTDAAASTGVARIAGGEINEAFGLGRAAEAALYRDLVDEVQYSAILDQNTCQVCEDLDGDLFDPDSPEWAAVEPPNPQCEGRDSCRCVGLWVAKGSVAAADMES